MFLARGVLVALEPAVVDWHGKPLSLAVVDWHAKPLAPALRDELRCAQTCRASSRQFTP
jgi:hypothetical protein